MSVLSSCSKCILFLSLVLLWAASITLIYIGSRTLMLASQYHKVSDNSHIRVSAICVLISGLLLLLVTAIGLVAYCKRSRLLLVVFYCLLMIVLFCEIGGVLLAVFHWSGLESSVKNVLQMELDAYATDSDAKFEVDQVQSELHCCGIDSYQDWNETAYFKQHQDYPSSCYPPQLRSVHHTWGVSPSNITTPPTPTFSPYHKGCLTLLSEQMHSKLTLIIAVGVIFVLFQVLGLHGSCILLCHSQPTVTQNWVEEEYARI